MQRLGSWAALGLLLAATLAGASTFDRRSWPGLVGDEATYLMQAQSLAWDGDLRYTRRDFDRFVEQWGTRPDGLILQSGDGGRTLTYSKPAAYAIWIAPFLRLSPTRGAAIANALLFALAAVVAARVLERRRGPAAPLWVAVWIFASVAFAYVFWAHSDLFLMCLTILALSLAYGAPKSEEPAESRRRAMLRWLAVGGLLCLVTMARPFYVVLLAPVVLAIPSKQRKLAYAAIALMASVLLAASSFASLAEGDAWTPYGGERQSFDSHTGFPEVGPSPADWQEQIAARGSRSWKPADEFDARQSAWNLLYFLAGRHVGILPYFLPLLLGLLAFRRGEGRGLLILAVLAASAAFLLTRPFNFYGGGGAIANRYFLPLYPALWFTAGRPARASWALLTAALAAPFLWPLWTQPRAFFLDEEGGYRYVSDFARLLPYETTQSHLKPSGGEDFVHHGLWTKPLTTSLRAEGDGARRIHFSGDHGQILLGSERPLEGVRLILLPPVPKEIEISGAESVASLPRRRGGSVRLLHFPRPRAVHRMWWTRDAVYLYQLGLKVPKKSRGFSFQLQPVFSPSPGEVGREGAGEGARG